MPGSRLGGGEAAFVVMPVLLWSLPARLADAGAGVDEAGTWYLLSATAYLLQP